MRPKPVLLDLFCGAGGCTKGYQRAGFLVVGVDAKAQPDYCGDKFIQMDALDFLERLLRSRHHRVAGYSLRRYAAIHASPPCQAYTSLRALGKSAGEGAPDLIAPVRELLKATGLPYVIENVPGSPLRDAVMLCGSSVGLRVRRHRLFETNFPVMVPPCAHGQQGRSVAVYGDHPQKTDRPPWRAETIAAGRAAMDIDWMGWRPLTQAIPPAYTELIGHQLAPYTQHLADCSRSRSTAYDCDCGLQEAWQLCA